MPRGRNVTPTARSPSATEVVGNGSANVGRRFNLDSHVGDYGLWLNLASRWASELDLMPEQIELLIFNDGLPKGSQWRS
jgi:hypothetical protein